MKVVCKPHKGDIRLLLLFAIFLLALVAWAANGGLALFNEEPVTPLITEGDLKNEIDEEALIEQEPEVVISAPKQNFIIEIIERGGGKEAVIGDEVSLHYRVNIKDGRLIDSSYNRKPLQIKLGDNQVIPGLDQGLEGMHVGGKRLLTIPSELAYGEAGYNSIPPNTTVQYEVELLSVFK